MIVGSYQCASPAGDIPAGFAAIDRALSAAAEVNVEMLVMPELFLPGYNATPATPPFGWEDIHDRLSEICRAHGVALAIGLPEYANNVVHNSAYVYGADGKPVARHRKLQLWGAAERAAYVPGDVTTVFDYGGTRFGLAICYDIEFPEHARAMARAGAEVILVPTANMSPHINVNLIAIPARAMENAVTIVYANYTGAEGDLDYVGHSVIAGPDGYPLAATGTGERLLVAELPSDLLENGIPFSTQLNDYRPTKEPR